MNKQEITLAGKTVTVGYCYATEIGFKTLSDSDINDFMAEILEAITAKRDPDTRKTIFLITAAMTAYYHSIGEKDIPISSDELISEMTPEEKGFAIGIIIGLRAKFYKMPVGEPKDEKPAKKRKGKEKN